MKSICWLFLKLFFVTGMVSCKPAQSNVYLIPTLHGLHNVNKHYSYDSLRQIISILNPEIIAVEMRPEDIDEDSIYLAGNYPLEMRMMKYWFPETKVVGFDWLGADIEGRLIPSNYWKEISSIKKFERELQHDSIYQNIISNCDTFTRERLSLLQTLSLHDLLSSKDSLLTVGYYQCLEEMLKDSVHERVLTFYTLRNEKMLQNINKIIREHKKKRIVILTGDDHYIYLKNKFKNNKLP